MSEGTALATLLDGLAAELARLHERALDLQFSTGDLVAAGGSEGMTAIQDLDRMTQELAGLSAYAKGLSGQCEAGWQVDAVAAHGTVALASLALRLCPDVVPPAPVSSEDDLIELFDKTG